MKLTELEIQNLLKIIDTPEKLDKLKQLLEEPQKQKTVQDWYNEFKKAEKLGYFPKHCETSAYNWGCCAIGARLQIENPELAKVLALEDGSGSLTKKGYILTDEASELGKDFWEAVNNNKVQEAKQLFNQIHSLDRIFKTQEEIAYDKLPFWKKLDGKNKSSHS